MSSVDGKVETEGRKRDSEATKTAILDAAETLFTEKGFADVSLTQLAKAAGVTKSLIHHHFGSKENLWSEVKARFFGAFFEGQIRRLLDNQPSLNLIKESIISYFKYLQTRPQFVRMNCWMLLEADLEGMDMAKEVISAGAASIKGAQEKGDIRDDIPADYILISFLSLVENWFLGHTRWGKTHFNGMLEDEKARLLEHDCYLDSMLTIFLEGITPKP